MYCQSLLRKKKSSYMLWTRLCILPHRRVLLYTVYYQLLIDTCACAGYEPDCVFYCTEKVILFIRNVLVHTVNLIMYFIAPGRFCALQCVSYICRTGIGLGRANLATLASWDVHKLGGRWLVYLVSSSITNQSDVATKYGGDNVMT